MTHSTPVLTTMHGVRQLIFATQSGLVSVNPQTGSLLWQFAVALQRHLDWSVPRGLRRCRVYHQQLRLWRGSRADREYNSTFVATEAWSNAAQESHWATPVLLPGSTIRPVHPDDENAELRCINVCHRRNDMGRWGIRSRQHDPGGNKPLDPHGTRRPRPRRGQHECLRRASALSSHPGLPALTSTNAGMRSR
jgi:hypothetical protein